MESKYNIVCLRHMQCCRKFKENIVFTDYCYQNVVFEHFKKLFGAVNYTRKHGSLKYINYEQFYFFFYRKILLYREWNTKLYLLFFSFLFYVIFFISRLKRKPILFFFVFFSSLLFSSFFQFHLFANSSLSSCSLSP